jgi:hypothetical protein
MDEVGPSFASSEAAVFWRYLSSSLDRLVELTTGVDPRALGWRPQTPGGANSLAGLAAHTLGNAEENILGVLAGLNRAYYTPVQLKRTHQFVDRLRLAPPNLGRRLDDLLAADPVAAGEALEELVADTVDLVEQHMPGVDSSAVRGQLGARQRPWAPTP